MSDASGRVTHPDPAQLQIIKALYLSTDWVGETPPIGGAAIAASRSSMNSVENKSD